MIDDVIVGSGPTAFAAAVGVIERGGHPLIIDFGPDQRGEASAFAGVAGIAAKGDDNRRAAVFNYPRELIASSDGKHLPLSSARGGLSRVWGAGILIRSAEDLRGFGSAVEGILAGYAALLRRIPAVGQPDRTSERFPWSDETPRAPQSHRYERLVTALQVSSTGDVLVGYPRVALDVRDPSACTLCGQYLSGCPEHLLFSADRALAALEGLGHCRFETGPVLSVRAALGHVEIVTPCRVLQARRIFLAAGPIGTPALLQRSGLAPPVIKVEDSAVFYAAFINKARPTGDEYDYAAAHAVAFAKHGGRDDFQLALYEANPEYRERFRQVVPWLPGTLMPDVLLRRINAGIGFLSPKVSGRLVVRTVPGGRTWVTRRGNPQTRAAARLVVRRVTAVTAALGLRAVPGAVIVPPTGSGYHAGASMPLGGAMVDTGGGLRGAPAVHIVDASVLPEVWAGSHTFTAMANAYRTAIEASG